jgi:hypothetical protein
MMPSIVREERILFTHKARKDIFTVEGMLIICYPGEKPLLPFRRNKASEEKEFSIFNVDIDTQNKAERNDQGYP